MRAQDIVRMCDELIRREKHLRKDIHDMNSVAWGMCTGAIDVLEELKEKLAEHFKQVMP
jgi:hypothetical protein